MYNGGNSSWWCLWRNHFGVSISCIRKKWPVVSSEFGELLLSSFQRFIIYVCTVKPTLLASSLISGEQSSVYCVFPSRVSGKPSGSFRTLSLSRSVWNAARGFQFFPKEGCVADITQLGLEEEQLGRESKGFGVSLTEGWENQAEYRASNWKDGIRAECRNKWVPWMYVIVVTRGAAEVALEQR